MNRTSTLRRFLLAGLAAATLALPQTAHAQATLPPNPGVEDVQRALESARAKFARGNQSCDGAQIADAILEAESLEPVARDLEGRAGADLFSGTSIRARRVRERIESFLEFARLIKADLDRRIANQCPEEVRSPEELETRFAAAEQDFARGERTCDRDTMVSALDRMLNVEVRAGSLGSEARNGGDFATSDRWSERRRDFNLRRRRAEARYYACRPPRLPAPGPGEPDVPGLDYEPPPAPGAALGAGAALLTESNRDLFLGGVLFETGLFRRTVFDLGVGADFLLGLAKETNRTGAFRDSVGLNWAAVPYVTAGLDISRGARLFARAGYGVARFNFQAEGPGFAFEDSSTDGFFAFGAGADLYFDGRNGVRIGYTRWDDLEEDGISANLFSLHYIRRLGGRR